MINSRRRMRFRLGNYVASFSNLDLILLAGHIWSWIPTREYHLSLASILLGSQTISLLLCKGLITVRIYQQFGAVTIQVSSPTASWLSILNQSGFDGCCRLLRQRIGDDRCSECRHIYNPRSAIPAVVCPFLCSLSYIQSHLSYKDSKPYFSWSMRSNYPRGFRIRQ